MKIGRREFSLGALTAVAGAVVAYFFPRRLEDLPGAPVAVGRLEDLAARGYIELTYGQYPAIVLDAEDGPVAFSRVCTHFSCTVQYEPGAEVFRCPCHAGTFRAQDGAVLSGPPVEPLRRFALFVEDGVIYLGER